MSQQASSRTLRAITLVSVQKEAHSVFPGIGVPTCEPDVVVGSRDPDARDLVQQLEARTPPGSPIPSLLLFGLVKLLGLTNLGPCEKVLWRVWFSFDGWNFGFEQQKFGLRMLCEADCYDNPLVRQVRGRAEAVTNLAEAYLTSTVVPEKVRQGSFTLENIFPSLSNRYWFLREQASQAYATPPPEAQKEVSVGLISTWFDFDKPNREGSALAAAAVESYFSMTEHVLSLAYAFLPPERRTLGFLEFLGSQWREKFKLVFDLDCSVEKSLYDQFVGLRDEWRNPIAHGGFLGGHGSLHFHLEGIGALPVRLRRTPLGATVGFRMPSHTFKEVLGLFDEFDTFLAQGPIRLGHKWISSGVDVAFDSRSLDKYQKAMRSNEDFANLIDRTIHCKDQQINMDF